MLQTDSEFSVPPRDAACTAASAFLILSAASVSSALLGCREVRSTAVWLCTHAENARDFGLTVWSAMDAWKPGSAVVMQAWKRYDFLVSHAAEPDKGLSLLRMGTNLSLLPLLFVMLTIPALSLLWILAVTLSTRI